MSCSIMLCFSNNHPYETQFTANAKRLAISFQFTQVTHRTIKMACYTVFYPAHKIWINQSCTWNHICYSSNHTANRGKNKTTSLSAGLRKFMGRCGVKNGKRRSWRRGDEEEGWIPQTDWLHRGVLALFLSRKQSSRCSLAAGVSLPQQWGLFNEPLDENMNPAFLFVY